MPLIYSRPSTGDGGKLLERLKTPPLIGATVPAMLLQCETMARLIARLSEDIQALTREIAMKQGQLLEQRGQLPPKADQLRKAREGLEMSQQRLEMAEVDLVELEAAFRQCCGSAKETSCKA